MGFRTMYESALDTLMYIQVCRTIELNSDFKVKLLALKRQTPNTKESNLVFNRS